MGGTGSLGTDGSGALPTHDDLIDTLACLRADTQMLGPKRIAILRTSGIHALLQALIDDAEHGAEPEVTGSAGTAGGERPGWLAGRPPGWLEAARAAARVDINNWLSKGYRVTSILSEGYPEILASIQRPPPLLFSEGHPFGDELRISVVGAPKPSELDLQAAVEVTRSLLGQGVTVVSGFDSGIDSTVHATVCEQGGRGVAVLSTGLDHCYPKRNARLRKRLLASGTTICSRFYPEETKSPAHFGMREVLTSGLSHATIIINSDDQSDVRIQARAAIEQNRGLILTPAIARNTDWGKEYVRQHCAQVAQNPQHAAALALSFTP
ncbi:MAG: DNA-processing protein DprA [Corynebacterium sp.]|nr:DNA-processing protein DprA [Corynebacterium sp.]